MCENTHGDLILWSRSIYTANEAVTNGVVHYIYEHLIKPSVNFPLWALTTMRATGKITELL